MKPRKLLTKFFISAAFLSLLYSMACTLLLAIAAPANPDDFLPADTALNNQSLYALFGFFACLIIALSIELMRDAKGTLNKLRNAL